MPLPLLFIGIAAATASLGVGKGIKAGRDQKEANLTNQEAQSRIDAAAKAANKSRKASGDALTNLGRQKVYVLDHDMQRFVAAFERIHNIELQDSIGMEELQKMKFDKQTVRDLKQLGSVASSLAGGMAGGALAGALTAFGAYGGAMTLGAASTGTAIASLSGAAATNATLAFLGGGALSVGGLGIAGGTAVLGGLVAGPALAVMGFVLGAKASANREKAQANLAKARTYEEEMQTARVLCNGIRMRATMYERLLIRLSILFEPLILQLERIIGTSGADFSYYTPEQKGVVASSLSLAMAIKAVMDTPLLTEEGNLTPESQTLIDQTRKAIEQYA